MKLSMHSVPMFRSATKLMLVSLLTLASTLTIAPAAEAVRRAGSTGAQFLKLGLDARSSGMAGASAALPGGHKANWGGAGNVLINPAGLAGSLERSFSVSQERRFAEIRHGLVHVSQPLTERSAAAATINWLQVPEQEITTLEQPEGTGSSYGYADLSLNLSLATRLTDRLAVGGTLRYIRQDMHREHAQGTAVDLGLLMDTGWRDLRLAMALANFGPRLKLEGEDLLVPAEDRRPATLQTEEFQLPLLFRIGLHDRLWSKDSHRLDAALQAEHPNDNRENLRLGLEYALKERFLLRAGRYFRRDLEQVSLGLGLRLSLPDAGTLVLDYAWTSQRQLAGTHLITATLLY